METIKIGHHEYKVEEKELVKSEHNDLLFGKCDSQSKTIELSTDLKHQDFKNEVLVHELLHAAVYESSIDLGEDEEHVVDALGKTLHGFLKENIDTLNEMYNPTLRYKQTIDEEGNVETVPLHHQINVVPHESSGGANERLPIF